MKRKQIVAEPALEADGLQSGVVVLREHEAHTNRASGVAHGLIQAERLRAAAGDSGAGDAALGVDAEAFQIALHLDIPRNAFLAGVVAALQQPRGGLATHAVGRAVGIAVEGAAGGIFRILGDSRGVQNVTVDHGDVARRVADADGVCGRGLIEIVSRRVAPELGVLVTRAADHLSGRRFIGLGLQRRDQLIHVVNFLGPQPRRVIGESSS